jgi:hypothetical protein
VTGLNDRFECLCGFVLARPVFPVRCRCGRSQESATSELLEAANNLSAQSQAEAAAAAQCVHRGKEIERLTCRSCGGSRTVAIYACTIHERCRLEHAEDDEDRAGMSCRWCLKRDKGFQSAESIR